MKKLSLITLVTICFNTLNLFAQKSEIKQPSSFFPKEKAQVLVVGTFHFDYPNLDVNKINDGDKIDVLKEPKKSEITELVNYIKKFKPTKIAIEATPQWNATEKLRQYKAGNSRNERDERYQIALRIASEMKMDTIYGIDASSFDEDLVKLDSVYFQKLFKDFDFQNDDKFNAMYMKWFDYEEKLPVTTNLLKYIKRINTSESHKLGYGAYLVGDFKLDNQRGADILSIWWYNRNLRIFRKLQEITESSKDRILVIFGNGHAAVLRQLLESSPEYKFIEFDSLK
ncbi:MULTISPECIES: DUF5694 domain-containing protein [unclassified Arcicella]|uniref:DUF5694 domain-containing protein n=1 Tax=unclassified Arcicella TaxID=2644986 RepID=UPI00285F9076|nr:MULTISPECIES: DUF5694 domain-containing protein [unclassified Arcicella]MDR6560297.1 hypothetical protein [Arcicella sp. BE51]MDR6810097.1 hypothetical protein [Arcicella sp. BE140]MDR6821446.1 hypothetical protein [Arcicella sp. BE139]